LLEAQGYSNDALVKTRERELLALSATDRAIQQQINATQDAAKTFDLSL